MSVSTVAELDSIDCRILQRRIGAYLEEDGPQVGDFVRFADGIERRISHVWPADWHDDNVASVQTSDGGSFYLSQHGCSFSGGLYASVKATTLALTGSCRRGSCWFFHHDHACAGNGVQLEVPIFNVWTCSEEATR